MTLSLHDYQNQTPASSTARQLQRVLSALLIKNRFIRSLTHTNLTRAEVHLLIETQARGQTTITELQQLLNMDQSSVSRSIKSLIQTHRINARPSKTDKRAKLLSLTATGHDAVAQIDEVAGAIYNKFASRLTPAEGLEILEFFRRIADYCGQPQCPIRKGEHEIRMQQRRMSRAIGVLSKDVFSSGLSATQWNVFNTICYSPYPPNPKSLVKEQNIPANSLTIILGKLESLGFIQRVQAEHDSRYVELKATTAGLSFLEKIETDSAKQLNAVLFDYTQQRKEKLLSILVKYVDQDPGTVKTPIAGDYVIKKLTTQKTRRTARTFAINEIVASGAAQFAPERFFAESSLAFGMFAKDEALQATCEISTHSKTAELSLLAWNKSITPDMAFHFMEEVFHILSKNHKIKRLKVTYEPARKILKTAGVLDSDDTIEPT